MTPIFEPDALERDRRPDEFLRMIRRSQRGRLKIYLGYAAGVGKTYQMLLDAHALHDSGIDVVVGYVETHGRPETAALVEGLEVIPRRRTVYRGVGVEEMDVDAVIARKPTAALVDELAHTNAPGSKNSKRYQDIQDILAAGIHVVTTLNVQHLESLYNTVESSLGVKVRERLPDSVVADADELVNVDVSEDQLRRRLEEGKVYTEERIQTAIDGFFKRRNLEMLRELTLRELAAQIDQRRRTPEEETQSASPDQVMVCLSSRGPNSAMLLRYASRIAGRLNRTWYAVYVQTRREDPLSIDAETQRHLSNTLTLARQLGAIVFTYKGEDIAGTLLQFAKEYRVGQIVIGRPGRKLGALQRLFGKRDIVEELIQRAEGVSIIILDTRGTAGERIVPAPAVPVNGPRPAAPARLRDLISRERVIFWHEPVSKDRILRELVNAVCRDTSALNPESVYAAIQAREALGSTFFGEGVAFPHARLEGISGPRVALGLPRLEITGVSLERPIQLVFLILSPASQPDVQVQILAAASRIATDAFTRQALARATTPADVLAVLAEAAP